MQTTAHLRVRVLILQLVRAQCGLTCMRTSYQRNCCPHAIAKRLRQHQFVKSSDSRSEIYQKSTSTLGLNLLRNKVSKAASVGICSVASCCTPTVQRVTLLEALKLLMANVAGTNETNLFFQFDLNHFEFCTSNPTLRPSLPRDGDLFWASSPISFVFFEGAQGSETDHLQHLLKIMWKMMTTVITVRIYKHNNIKNTTTNNNNNNNNINIDRHASYKLQKPRSTSLQLL